MPRGGAACWALARLREAMATMLVCCPRCMPGMTFLRPMAAVERTPQRSEFVMEVMIDAAEGKTRRHGVELQRSGIRFLALGRNARAEPVPEDPALLQGMD